MAGTDAKFPIDMSKLQKCAHLRSISRTLLTVCIYMTPINAHCQCRLVLDPSKPQLSAEQRSALKNNIQIMRDAIVLFTATGAARGVSGHTGAQDSYATLQ